MKVQSVIPKLIAFALERNRGYKYKYNLASAVISSKTIFYGRNSGDCRINGKSTSSVHAEVDAIKRNGKKSIGRVLIVIRVDADGNLKFSKPCKNCSDIIKTSGIKKVYYISSQGNLVWERAFLLSSEHLSRAQRDTLILISSRFTQDVKILSTKPKKEQ